MSGFLDNFIVPAISLFLVLNAIGNIPIFVAVLAPYERHKQGKIIIREMVIALGILFLFGFCGDAFLNLLGVSHSVIRMGGGLLLLLVALSMLFPKPGSDSSLPEHEPIIVPLATPVVAGPGSMSFVMVLAKQIGEFNLFWVILAAWIPAFLLTYASSYIKNLLGDRGLMACQKLGGMLITLIAVQMIAQGVVQTVSTNFAKVELTPKTENLLNPKPSN